MVRRSGRSASLALLAVLAGLSVPAGALAAPGGSCSGSPDNASVNQYCESVPSLGGQVGIDDGAESAASHDRAIPAATREALGTSELGRILVPGSRGTTDPKTAPARPGGRSSVDPRRSAAQQEIAPSAPAQLSGSALLGGVSPVLLLIGAAIVAALFAAPYVAKRRRAA